eukprot:SAG11_NODE_16717_length_539_cov_1.463636_2_plen_63_part_01
MHTAFIADHIAELLPSDGEHQELHFEAGDAAAVESGSAGLLDHEAGAGGGPGACTTAMTGTIV